MKKICIILVFALLFIALLIMKHQHSTNYPSNLVGTWHISYATEIATGKEYDLQALYGSGIKYGGALIFNRNGTFSRYIGINTGEKDAHEGKYTVDDGVIALEYYNGEKKIAYYKNNEIQYVNEIDDINIYEFYVHP